MARRARPGIAALLDVTQAREKLNAAPADSRGPRINAGGRISEADLGLRLLLSEDRVEALALAETLEAVNRQRQDVEASIMEAALDAAETQAAPGGRRCWSRRGLAPRRCRHRRRPDQGTLQPPGLCGRVRGRGRQRARGGRWRGSTWVRR